MAFSFAGRKVEVFSLLLAAAFGLLYYHFGLEARQVAAVTTVLALVLGTVLFWEIRLAIALVGAALLLASGLLSTHKFIEFASLDIILFLAGMMVFVAHLEKNAFFERLIAKIFGLVGGGGKRIIFLLMFLSALFAALVDEVTSILFMLSIVLHLAARAKVNPVPFVMLTVFATNIGSSATAIGNPVGVMIALNAKLSFSDFLSGATPISFLALLAGIAVIYAYFKREVDEFAAKSRHLSFSELVPAQGGKKLVQSSLLFIGVLSALVLHSTIEHALGLEKNSMLLGTALGAAGLILLIESQNARHFVETKIDWWTLLFFMILFASVGVLEETGVMQLAASSFAGAFGSSKIVAIAAVILLAGFLSAFLDNVLAVAVFVPLIRDLQSTAVGGDHLWWSLLFGATLFGNLTIIGSTANIVALGMLEKRGLPKIAFVEWLKPGLFVVGATALVAFAALAWQYGA